PLSAQISVIVNVGSSAVLHCDCKPIASSQLSKQSPYIKWRTTNELVFERLGEEHFQGEGYEDRVDVPEDKLRKGNCSLVLKEVKAEDAGVYESYLQVKRSKRSIQTTWKLIQSVELSVHGSPGSSKQPPILITARVGSSAVLPCDCSEIMSSDSPLIEWRTFSGTVFERLGEEHYEGEGYEGRVDVPEDKLKKGNCSLVLKDVRPEDAGVYESYLVITGSEQTRRVFIQSVELSVEGTLSAQSSVTVSVGSSAVLHCDFKPIASSQLSEQSPYIEWKTTSQTVFERLGEVHIHGEGYEGRVDVPEDKLKKGNCSLVLKEVKAEDAGIYESYLVVKRSKRSIQTKWVFIQSVELSVNGKERICL
ncbi:hypothetical protein AMEX_G4278, partial [Astyanax mexicanus]